ncbi:MAG TPA: ATP-binding protein [Bryobacteraceae bacterium]|nr:ATP-binding protein [Bryobacteraceae bacterium]
MVQSAPWRTAAILRYGLAIVLVAAAHGLTFLLRGVVSIAGFLFFYIAVVASAWFGGKWPGALAVILSALAVEYYFTAPFHSFGVSRESLPLFVEFAVSALVVGWFSSWRKQTESALQRARDELQLRVEERTAELKQRNGQLLAEMAERKRAENAFYEAQSELARVTRLSTLGVLAASISHEVNQPLAAVVTNADACMMWLSSEPPNLEEVRTAVDSIAQQGTRASEVVRRIRAMFSKAGPERATVPMNDVIGETAALMQQEASRNQVKLDTELAGDLPAALGDRVQLQQVLVNLIQNGIEAMSGITDRPRRLVIRSEKRGDNLLIAVRDSGVGIDPRNDRRMFDAFFTTKPQGMGMGLAICQSIVEAHGGRLWASANEDYGATVQFTLPAEHQAGS